MNSLLLKKQQKLRVLKPFKEWLSYWERGKDNFKSMVFLLTIQQTFFDICFFSFSLFGHGNTFQRWFKLRLIVEAGFPSLFVHSLKLPPPPPRLDLPNKSSKNNGNRSLLFAKNKTLLFFTKQTFSWHRFTIWYTWQGNIRSSEAFSARQITHVVQSFSEKEVGFERF